MSILNKKQNSISFPLLNLIQKPPGAQNMGARNDDRSWGGPEQDQSKQGSEGICTGKLPTCLVSEPEKQEEGVSAGGGKAGVVRV